MAQALLVQQNPVLKAALVERGRAGLSQGKRLGVAEGKQLGIAEGKQLGIVEGKQLGIVEGKQLGIVEGKQLGIVEGKQLGFAEGATRGKAETLLVVLAARGVLLGAGDRARILDERDLVRLDRWIMRAVTCVDVAELLAEP
jgi:hypothetical protein